MGNKVSQLRWVFLIGFFLILALPLLNLPPLFSPPDWGKTIVFRIILSILIFIFICQILKGTKFLKRNLVPLKSFWLLFALLGIFLLSTIFSQDPYFSFWGDPYRAGGFLNFAFYIIFAILAFLILRKSDWQKIWEFAIFIGILVSMVAIFQQFGLISKFFIPFVARPPSTVGGPIFLAIYLLLLSFPALSFGIKSKVLIKKFFYFFSFLLFIFIAVFITQTRAVFIGLVVGFLWFLFAYPKKLIWLKISAVIILILGVYGIYYLNTQPELPKFIQENEILKATAGKFSIEMALKDPRISSWKVSWEAMKNRPISGYGPENFSIGFDQYYDPSLPKIQKDPYVYTSWWDRAHNFIFDISVTAGISALIIYLLLFGTLFWQLQKLKYYPNLRMASESTNNSNTTVVAHGIQATFIGYLVANFFSFDTFSTYLLSFLLIGYSLHLIYYPNLRMASESTNKKIQRTVLWKLEKYRGVIIFLLCIVLVWFIWVYNIKPLQINTEINIACSRANYGDYSGAISRMEKILGTHTFLDNYLRLNYIEIINNYLEKTPELVQELLAQKAIEALKENTKIRPNYTRNWILLGNYTNVLIEKGALDLKEEANYYFERAYQLSPKRQEVFIGWLKTELLTGDYLKAKEKAQKCINLNPELGDCWWFKGLINIYSNEIEEAQEDINMASQKEYPVASEDSLLQLVNAYLSIKNYQELAKIYQKLIEINPNNPQYHASLAVIYKEMGDFENARKEALIALELLPEARKEIEKFLKELP